MSKTQKWLSYSERNNEVATLLQEVFLSIREEQSNKKWPKSVMKGTDNTSKKPCVFKKKKKIFLFPYHISLPPKLDMALVMSGTLTFWNLLIKEDISVMKTYFGFLIVA